MAWSGGGALQISRARARMTPSSPEDQISLSSFLTSNRESDNAHPPPHRERARRGSSGSASVCVECDPHGLTAPTPEEVERARRACARARGATEDDDVTNPKFIISDLEMCGCARGHCCDSSSRNTAPLTAAHHVSRALLPRRLVRLHGRRPGHPRAAPPGAVRLALLRRGRDVGRAPHAEPRPRCRPRGDHLGQCRERRRPVAVLDAALEGAGRRGRQGSRSLHCARTSPTQTLRARAG